MAYDWNKITRDAENARDLMTSDFQKGWKEFSNLFSQYGKDGMLYYQRGKGLEHHKLYRAAIEDYKSAEHLFPKREFKNLAQIAYLKLESQLQRNQTQKLETQNPSPESSFSDPVPDDPFWDRSQMNVIYKPKGSRLLVNAGPGQGKTAVACARIAYLIDKENVSPSCIWLISFTRTAVREMQSRISTYLKNRFDIDSIRIETIDSLAWKLHSGFNNQARIISYDDNIKSLLELMESDKDIADYLENNIEHLVIDEGQDIVGLRMKLLDRIIALLSPESGVTIFHDPAQAIYGFSVDEDPETVNGPTKKISLPEKLKSYKGSSFREFHLEKIYRTSSPSLLRIFSETRKKLLDPQSDPNLKLENVLSEIMKNAEGSIPEHENSENPLNKDTFILFRRRAEVLLKSSFMFSRNQPHRIRISGLPVRIVPWIGICLSGFSGKVINKRTFLDLWRAGGLNEIPGIPESEKAWQDLVRAAGKNDSLIDLDVLTRILSTPKPPSEFCIPDTGEYGPIIGTIHACKGRETEEVHLMIPVSFPKGSEAEIDEEARILYVGATRGRKSLFIGKGYNHISSCINKSNRVYSIKKNIKEAQVMIGCERDLLPSGLAGKGPENFLTPESVSESQNFLRSIHGRILEACAITDHSVPNYPFRLFIEGKHRATLSGSVNEDLFTIGNQILPARLRPPDAIKHLWINGIQTIVITDSPERDRLHPPWNRTGILLAPILFGYTKVYFPFRRH